MEYIFQQKKCGGCCQAVSKWASFQAAELPDTEETLQAVAKAVACLAYKGEMDRLKAFRAAVAMLFDPPCLHHTAPSDVNRCRSLRTDKNKFFL